MKSITNFKMPTYEETRDFKRNLEGRFQLFMVGVRQCVATQNRELERENEAKVQRVRPSAQKQAHHLQFCREFSRESSAK